MVVGWVAVVALGVGCKTQVEARPDVDDIEFFRPQEVGDGVSRCQQVEAFEVVALPDEESADPKRSVVELKALNYAAKLRATHVVLSEQTSYACDESGEPLETNEGEDAELDRCVELDAIAYECAVGNAPPM